MAQGPPRLLQPKADARIRPGRPVASKSTLKAVPGVADSATTGWPVAGQLQRQPAPSRTEVERSACTVPPSSQVVGVNMAIAASCASWRDRNDVAAVSAVGRQSAPMRWFRLSCATAHSMPASAASNAWVERYWFADARCSKTRLRLTKATPRTITKNSSIVTASAATPCYRVRGRSRCVSTNAET
jgi:hypothetical protein